MALLRKYGYQTTAEDEFDFNFEIPANCNFTTEYDSGENINTINIVLNSGQSQPSSTYNTEYTTFNSSEGVLRVSFEQTLNGITIKKPLITVSN
ncbi:MULTISPECIES: hypothetical protein [Flavobacterium]|uniref:hypothetical protein n=1 Tax=Flavobacterium TaxID=237 RepID=UPI001FCBDB81|nr:MULTISPECIES: hypothetical protein [Flavobacterium]UOK41911.1 hypothetical protein LZF87_11420 [Flavobacterium enshiense]